MKTARFKGGDVCMKKKILVVDDEKLVRWAMEQILIKEGYEVVTAESGEVVARIIERDKDFDLIISDIRLPGIDGWEVFDLVKTSIPDTKMIAVTAEDTPFDSEDLTKRGVSGVIQKPFYVFQIKETVEKVLKEK